MNTTVTSAESIFNEISVYLIYVVEGFAMCLGNGLIVATIASNQHLRHQKEMLLMAGLAATDFVYGFATFLAGALRIEMTLQGVIKNLVTPWDCMIWLPTPLFTIGQETVGLMMVILSVDRYIAVTHFSLYRSMGLSYAYKVFAFILSYAAVISVALFSVSYFLTERIATVTRLCVGPWAAPAWFGTFDSGITAFYGYLSVIIYAAVYYKFRKHSQNMITDQRDAARARQMALQRRVTVTLGIVTFFTFIFYCTPIAFMSVAGYFGITINSTIIYTLTRINSIANIFIYLVRQSDVRQAMIALVTCRRFGQQNGTQMFVPSIPRRTISIKQNGED